MPGGGSDGDCALPLKLFLALIRTLSRRFSGSIRYLARRRPHGLMCLGISLHSMDVTAPVSPCCSSSACCPTPRARFWRQSSGQPWGGAERSRPWMRKGEASRAPPLTPSFLLAEAPGDLHLLRDRDPALRLLGEPPVNQILLGAKRQAGPAAREVLHLVLLQLPNFIADETAVAV